MVTVFDFILFHRSIHVQHPEYQQDVVIDLRHDKQASFSYQMAEATNDWKISVYVSIEELGH